MGLLIMLTHVRAKFFSLVREYNAVNDEFISNIWIIMDINICECVCVLTHSYLLMYISHGSF